MKELLTMLTVLLHIMCMHMITFMVDQDTENSGEVHDTKECYSLVHSLVSR